jgi:hypothetical protein
MSNSNTKQEDRTIDSEDMFGNGNSLLENLSSSFSGILINIYYYVSPSKGDILF